MTGIPMRQVILQQMFAELLIGFCEDNKLNNMEIFHLLTVEIMNFLIFVTENLEEEVEDNSWSLEINLMGKSVKVDSKTFKNL